MRYLLFALVLIGLQISPAACLAAQVNILARAQKHLPTLSQITDLHWPDAPMREVMAGQIEQESRWNTKAELKTSREYGIGLAQITVTERFNNFEAAKRISALKDWQWEDRFNPRYQMTYLVLTDRANIRAVSKMFLDDANRWAGALVAYNAGMGTVLQRRAIERATTGRNSGLWFSGLDKYRMAYEKRLLYGRDLGERRNEYPHLVIRVRAPKYRGML